MRLARTTSDLFVASRAVTPWWNAAAISGEYLSAASFLGIAGLQMKIGSGALWLPLGFTAGYLALLLFVAAPLRRFGAYTISDFAEARLRSPALRTLSAAIVLLIGGFYLVPQLKGAGLTLGEVVGAPYWVGVVAVGVVVALNVALGGMRGITYVQAFQYWLKTFAIALPACLLLLHLGGLPERAAMFGQEYPRAPEGGLVVDARRAGAGDVPGGRDGARRRDARCTAVDGEEVLLPAGRVELPDGDRGAGRGGHRRAARLGVGEARLRQRRRVAAVRLLAADRDVPRHDGAAAHPGALLHQPRRARRRGARPCACSGCSACSTRSPPSTARSAACSCRSST